MKNVISEITKPSRYLDSDHDVAIVVSTINQILSDTAYQIWLNGNKNSIKCDTDLISTTEITAHFTKIQNEIIKEIKQEKFSIRISVAWFTDPIIFNELVKKANDGVNVQLIIGEDEINSNSGLDFENHFETTRISPFGVYDNNILHNKFCIIDLVTTITGSYNYTKRAQYNRQNIDIARNGEHASAYAARVIELKQGKILI